MKERDLSKARSLSLISQTPNSNFLRKKVLNFALHLHRRKVDWELAGDAGLWLGNHVLCVRNVLGEAVAVRRVWGLDFTGESGFGLRPERIGGKIDAPRFRLC